jgi:Acyl-CoA reductase (LuxC)
MIDILLPVERSIEEFELDGLLGAMRPSKPFDSAAVGFCHKLSRNLFAWKEAPPAAKALAFWLRPANIKKLEDEQIRSVESLSVPRGLVFHVAPSNVDTIFLYSWILSLLAGNANVIRVSLRTLDLVRPLLSRVGEVFDSDDGVLVSSNTLILTYNRSDEVSAILSSRADVRVVWGGDATVETFRRFPQPPRSTELNFPDRLSMCAIQAQAFLALETTQQEELVRLFYNDAYVFDQLACSSPRRVLWVGSKLETESASTIFRVLLQTRVTQEKYEIGPAEALGKLVFSSRTVLDGQTDRVTRLSNELHFANQGIASITDMVGFPGGGLFLETASTTLFDSTRFMDGKLQTLTVFGFSQEELRSLATKAGSLCVDRIVPIGSALRFGHQWDGQNFFTSFTRTVSLEG